MATPPALFRRSAAGAVAVVVLAGCGLTGTSVGTGSTSPSTPTVAPYTPTTAPVPTTVVESTAPVVADASTTTEAPASSTTRPAVVVGPALNLVTLLESPAETRKQPGTDGVDGVLVKAASAAHARAFVFSTRDSTLAGLRTAPGWTLSVLSRDRQWTPAAMGTSVSTFVGRRWAVYVDAPPVTATSTTSGPRDVQLVSFDVTTNAFASYLETPNRATWFGDNLQVIDDHTVGILFDPDPAPLELRTTLALRRIDLLNGRVSDERVELPQGGSYNRPFLGNDGSISLYSPGSDQVLYRPAGGQFTVLQADSVRPDRLIDGLYLDWNSVSSDPDNDVSLVDAQGGLVTKVHSWRFASRGPGVGYVGFADGQGYFGAFTAQGVDGHLNLGVYDTATATWDWVFDPASPVIADGGIDLTVAGTA